MKEAVAGAAWERPLADMWNRFDGAQGVGEGAWSLNRRHAESTIYIVGSGPQLNAIPAGIRQRLEREIVIGVNRTFLVVPLKYFISSYPWEVALAQGSSDATCLQLTRDYDPAPIVPGSVRMRRVHYSPLVGLPDRLVPPIPTLCTLRNIALAASHLAMIMGARRLVFIGVEQVNRAHFWQLDADHRAWLRSRVEEFRASSAPYLFKGYDRDKMLGVCFDHLSLDGAELQKQPFYEDHAPTFASYFSIMKHHDIDIIGTTPDSIVCRAGARYMPLEEATSEYCK